MREIKKIALLFATTLLACSDYTLNPLKEEIPGIEAPNIEVLPAALNFGHLDAGVGESSSQVITITNFGLTRLTLIKSILFLTIQLIRLL